MPRGEGDARPECRTRTPGETVSALLDAYGRTYASEIGIPLHRDRPSAWFRLLCASILFAHRINADAAVSAARALAKAGWKTSRSMAKSDWADRVRILNRAGFARYDESTARTLGEDAALVNERYGGDLRKLRERAGRNPERELALLQEFKGIGPVGADIFAREAQLVWEELRPFADGRARRAAARLGLPTDPDRLGALVPPDQVARLMAALVRVDLADGYSEFHAA